ncbi:MAG TPA: TPM domain-containing protein [Bacteroidales bacterium]|nr:TPM domain-containing protein [Bacteroidales bacterium]
MPNARQFFSTEEKQAILDAIISAEKDTSGEIRVHIENHCGGDVLDRAAFLFKHLKMNETAQHNGILFYLAVKDRKFAVIGDAGINAVVEENFWESIRHSMTEHFKRSAFTAGLIKGIETTGKKLKAHFPYSNNDVNELSDEISFGS